MDIKIHATNFQLNKAQEEKLNEKVAKLESLAGRLSDESAEAKLDVELQASQKDEETFACHLTIFVPGDTLRAEAEDASLENVVDDVIGKIRGQIEKYKARTQHINDHK